MRVSDEALQIALRGRFGDKKEQPCWRVLPLPEGRQEIPEWCKGMHIRWWDDTQYISNSPDFTLKTTCNARHWPDKRFERHDTMFIARHPDGRAEVYYQKGKLTGVMMKRFRHADGRMSEYAYGGIDGEPPPGEWIETMRFCTPQEQGFGGAHIDITMVDGAPVTLRGPWHGGAPDGYQEVAYVDQSDGNPQWVRRRKGWWDTTATGGLFIQYSTFIRMFARFQPHLRLASVNEGLGARIQPLKPEWREPKAWWQQRIRIVQENFAWLAIDPDKRPPYASCAFPGNCGGKPDCVGNVCARRKFGA